MGKEGFPYLLAILIRFLGFGLHTEALGGATVMVNHLILKKIWTIFYSRVLSINFHRLKVSPFCANQKKFIFGWCGLRLNPSH